MDDNDLDDVLFGEDESGAGQSDEDKKDPWVVLIVDDEEDIHKVTRLIFRGFQFENKKIEFISAYSSTEARKIIQERGDISLILLDVVMETETAGLDFAKYLRHELKNHLVRVILRTGQAGRAPEKKIILEYDINDYKEKTELTKDKFFTTMVSGLRSFRDLMKIEESKEEMASVMLAMDNFVPHDFLKLLNKKNLLEIRLGDFVEEELTILFLDVASFTKLSEQILPLQCYQLINDLLSYLEPAITQHSGFIDKYIGDAIMAVFQNTDQAILAALQMLNELKKFNAEIKKMHPNIEWVRVGIGINFGPMVVGAIGYYDRMDCTVMGDAVNTASRLEKLNRIYYTNLIISDSALNNTGEDRLFHYRFLGKIRLKGHQRLTAIYEVFDADDDEMKKLKIQTQADFSNAVAAYDNKDFDEASKLFAKVITANPRDVVARDFMEKIKNSTK